MTWLLIMAIWFSGSFFFPKVFLRKVQRDMCFIIFILFSMMLTRLLMLSKTFKESAFCKMVTFKYWFFFFFISSDNDNDEDITCSINNTIWHLLYSIYMYHVSWIMPNIYLYNFKHFYVGFLIFFFLNVYNFLKYFQQETSASFLKSGYQIETLKFLTQI